MEPLNPQAKQILEHIRKLALEIELVARDGLFPENQLQKLILLLASLDETPTPELQRLSQIKDHLHPGMSVRHFQNFMIPIERLLGKSLREDEFMVTHQDRPQNQIHTQSQTQKIPLIFVLENIRSAFNVGSIFRLGDAIGVEAIYLCGYTPLPEAKTALGTQDIVPYRQFSRLEDALAHLEFKAYQTWALETAEQARPLFTVEFSGPTALIVGNERFGLEPDSLRKMKGVLCLPMNGMKNSLNVSTALSATAFEWRRQWGLSHD